MVSSPVFILFIIFSAFLLNVQGSTTSSNECSSVISQELGSLLSPDASIVHSSYLASRWSAYHAPIPGSIVNVATEQDVIDTVKYCIKHNLRFFAQSGGHSWSTTFNLGDNDVIINMRGLNKVHINDAKDQITFGGGSLVGEVLDAAYLNKVESTISTCNCVGIVGATLGGGFHRLMGHYGLIIDNLLSMNVVLADGQLTTVTPTSSPDLWWAMRGAGANFGVVTSVTMKAFPPINDGVGAIGKLYFSPDKLEALIQTASDFEYQKEMLVNLYMRTTGTGDDASPTILFMYFYTGPASEAKAAFKPLYDLGPLTETLTEVQYNEYNTENEASCGKGLRRPGYTVGMKKLEPKIFRKVWDDYVSLLAKNPSMSRSTITIEAFSPEVLRKFGESSSAFPHRSINFLGIVSLAYEDAKLDPVAEEFGGRVRELWQKSSGFEDLKVYINHGHGDEDLGAIYGESLPRLMRMKKEWDKDGRFTQMFPISPANEGGELHRQIRQKRKALSI